MFRVTSKSAENYVSFINHISFNFYIKLKSAIQCPVQTDVAYSLMSEGDHVTFFNHVTRY